MATAATVSDDQTPGLKKRRSSFLWIPPNMSELRVVLLGNSWSQRSSVGNFILGETVFNTEEEPDQRLTVRGPLKDKHIVLINTPDLLQPNISDDKLTEDVQTCVRLSDPGPHVFLLVLQPEDFTEEHKLRLQSVLENFSDQSLDHSLVLTSADRDRSSDFRHMKPPPLTEMIRMCRYRHLWMKELERPELLTRLGQIVKENDGDHVSCDVFEDTSTLPSDHQHPKQLLSSVLDAVKAAGWDNLWNTAGSKKKTSTQTSELRIVLLGKTEDKQTKLGNFIIKAKAFHGQKTNKCVASCGEWRGNPVTVVKTPDVFSLSVEEMNSCVTLCSLGPNVLLLLVKPSDFTEQNRETLKSILSLFGPDALKHSMVVTTHDGSSTTVSDLLRDCGGRHYSMTEDNHTSLMQKIEKIVHENTRTFLTIRPKSEHIKPALNLVLCGRRGAGKTSAAKAVLGHTEFYSVSDSSESVQGHGEVCGRWVSLVELPALYGKTQEEVMKESFRCVSHCHPEGVHAFILVLPVNPLTDEDKGELKTIQNTFSSRVDDFTMILFTVESDPTAPAVVDFVNKNRDIQEILQSCGGRHVVVNIKDRQQIPELLDMVENMRVRPITDKPHSYTTETFAFSQIEKISSLQTELDLSRVSDEEQGPECLRIVLIGKTGSGKSASGNTILGGKDFKSALSQTSVTRLCQKKQAVVDGRPVSVVDTPGLFDTNLSHDEVNEEMFKCISLLAPGPHVFLLVLQIGRFTPEEKETLKLIKEAFGKNAQQFTFILFTQGDELEREEQTIDEYIENSSDESFKKLIADCGRRYHVFNNCDKNNHTQVRELMTKINTMVKTNGGSCYTNEMLQEAEAAIKKEMERILKEKEEEMRREREELQRKHEEEMEKQRAGIEEERKLREKQLEEMKEKIKREQEMREEENKKRKQEETQKLEMEQNLTSLEENIRSESESKEKISKELEKRREDMRREQKKKVKKQNEWWEERLQEDEQRQWEQKRRIRKLQEEFEQKRVENRIRREREEKEKKYIEEKYENKLKTLKKTHEEEARQTAEEFNEFKKKYKKIFEDQKEEHEKEMKEKDEQYDFLQALTAHKEEQLKKKHLSQICELVKCVNKDRKNTITKINDLLTKQEEEMMKTTTEEEKKRLQQKHEDEKNDLTQKLLKEDVSAWEFALNTLSGWFS